MEYLQQWLEEFGLRQYAHLFAGKAAINPDAPLSLDDRELARLGVASTDCSRLRHALAERRRRHSASSMLSVPECAPGDAGARAERRHLTVLFCDVVGSTALSVRLDL